MKKTVMVTAYSYPSARICDEARADIILVGDSAANVVHGFESTKSIGMNEMLMHVRAVCRAKPKALVVADMPHKSYTNPLVALENAKKFIEAGANGVKLEGAKIHEVEALAKNNVRVMGHLGYLPQSDSKPKVKKNEKELLEDALALERAGCEWIVLELVPEKIAKRISEELSIPAIGIGSGRYCGGQVLVFHDLLGLGDPKFKPRFLKKYANLRKDAVKAVKEYVKEVRSGKFPAKKNAY